MTAAKSKSTACRIAEYVSTVERETGKKVVRAITEGRKIVLEFEGAQKMGNPADLVDMSK